MATNNSSKRPATTLRCGNIKATIWQNVNEKGSFFATTFCRPFKDQFGTWCHGTSFALNDLEALIAMRWMLGAGWEETADRKRCYADPRKIP